MALVVMMTWVTAGILFFLSGLHIYWMLGGKKGTLAVIPSNGLKPLFRPRKTGTGMVAGALAFAGWMVLELGVVDSQRFPDWLLTCVGWILSIVFILRAIGDFTWVGFFKKKKGTLFAKWDNALFSPLCLFLGICMIFITTTK